MKKVHGLRLNTRSTKLGVKKQSNETKFVVELTNRTRKKCERDKNINPVQVKEIEVVPTVQNVNRHFSLEIDRKKKERRNEQVLKNKLVRKGKEWVVEKVPVAIKMDEIKQLINNNSINTNKDKEDLTNDLYLNKMMELAKQAKKEGRTMFFPCDKCNKVCQALCGLKLHRRIHNSKAKPFKPKVWLKRRNVKNSFLDQNGCRNEELVAFYEKFIGGSKTDLELFIRECKNIENEETAPEKGERGKITKETRIKNNKITFKRRKVIRKEQNLHRIEKIKKLREKIYTKAM